MHRDNISAVQLREPSFATNFERVLKDAGLGMDDIELEVTESTALANDEVTVETLSALRDIGTRLSFDDFGTGQSSIRNLRCFEFSRVKIDRSFVRELPESRDDAILASGIIAMVHGLGMSIVAEGVETEDQAHCLRAMGCDDLQGFLLSVPLTPTAFEDFLRKEKSDQDE